MGFVSRLLLALAVVLMPFGMAPARPSVAHRSATTQMPMGHCPDQAPTRDMKGGIPECTMACAVAVPADGAAVGEPLLIVCDPIRPGVAEPLHGLHPETAIPPPRRS